LKTVELLNLEGARINNRDVDLTQISNNTINIDLPKLAIGVYVVRLKMKDAIVNTRLIVED
jgi:hypothetical protein